MTIPADIKIYHITHLDNLDAILRDGSLWSDSEMTARGGPDAMVGISHIKQRRLGLPVTPHPGLMVGACVPFYFCPRSVMLYLLCRGNHPDLSYRDGQEPILHLEGDLREVVAWAEANSHRWAFSLSNAGARYTEFRHRLGRLGDIDWASVAATDFRNTSVREAKQAEFLVERNLPFSLIKRVGAYSTKIAEQVQAMLGASAHRPKVEVRREWYF